MTTRDAVFTGYVLENLNRIKIEKSSIKTWIISNEGQTPFAPRILRKYRFKTLVVNTAVKPPSAML